MAVTPQVKAAVDQLLGLWGTSNSKGSHQRVIRDFTDIADSVPVDTTGGTDQQRLEWAMKVLEGGAQAYPYFSKKGAGGWESAAMPLSKAYAPASKVYSEWVPDFNIDESGNPVPSAVDYTRWAQVAPQLGFGGQTFEAIYDPEYGNVQGPPTAAFQQFVNQKRAEGYDFVQKRSNLHNYNNYYGFKLPSGEVVAQQKTGDDDDIKSFFTDFVLPAAGAAFTMSGGLNSLMGGGTAAAAPANALAGIAEGMIPGGLTAAGIPATAAELAAVGALTGAAPLTAADIGRGLGDVLGAASDTATGADGVIEVAGAEGLGGGLASADRATLYGNQGYGAGMTGAQTSAYDTTLGLTSSKATADVISNAVGTVNPILDQAINLLKTPAGQAVVGGVGSVVSGVMQAEAAKDVAAQQAGAAENALKLQKDMFEYQQSLLAPYRKAGEAALERLTGAMGLGGPAQQQQMLEMDPGYGFRLGEGMKALERMQAARGNMLSGGALKAGTEYAQKFASGEYQNAFNRLADIAGIGRSTATQQGSAAQQFGQTAGQTSMDVANALAAGRYGRTSAYTGALEGALGAYENYLNRQQRNQVYRDIYGRMLGGGG